MASIRRLLVRLRPDVRVPEPELAPAAVPEPPACDHLVPAVRPVKVDEAPAVIRVIPAPQRAPEPPASTPRPTPGPAWPSRRTWLNATVTDADKLREARILARLARLTEQVGPLEAARIVFAPELRKDRP